ncbi:hypothetical protein MLD38_039010 [Melastoma candidum]|uniref:Uncharacterized protein n=1 Tax=Melastoma candidum TaxID=119954 RepID=A0ACB9L1G5_9MYRT|nr:hypothetical protein MLD38_039010 [Melastoma candidum]
MSDPKTVLRLPVLDVSLPVVPETLSVIAEACKEWGFFLITNHGVTKDLYEDLDRLCRQFFDLPPNVKVKLGPFSSAKTYTPHFIASPFFESIRVSGPDFLSSAHSSADMLLLDQQKQEFCDVLEEYCTKMSELSNKIIQLMLMILGDGLSEKYYKSEFGNCHGYLRVNHYSPPEDIKDEVEGLGTHADMSCITIVYQDDVGGLQVRSKDGEWLHINPQDGILVVNVGDMLQAWSNDKLRSSEHRVVLKKPINRFSLAFFWSFEDDKVITSPEDVVGEGNARLYKPFVSSEYVKFRESSKPGMFEKVGFTVKGFAGAEPPLDAHT